MYQDYFGIGENPFSLTPDPRYLYMSEGHKEALAHLLYGVSEGGGFVLLTGEVGTGKTTVCRCLLEQMPGDVEVAYILNPRLNDVELLASICEELGIGFDKSSSHKVLIDGLNQYLLKLHARGHRAILIVDEAQNLSPEVLEQIRLLTNLEINQHKLLQVILIGQPELTDLLNRRELRQLAQRISSRHHLEELTLAETKTYITHRVIVGGLNPATFPPAACSEVYKLSHGIPRLINSLCDRCLLAAYAQGTSKVNRKMVRTSAAEVFGRLPRNSGQVMRILPWAAILVVSALAIIDFLEPPNHPLTEGMTGATSIVKPSDLPATFEEQASKSRPEADLTDKWADSSNGVVTSTSGPIVALEASEEAGPSNAPNGSTESQDSLSEPLEVAAEVTVLALDEVAAVNDGGDDEAIALAQLFGLWHQDYEALAGRDVCAKAHQAGLRCLRGKSSVEALTALNRPAVLYLTSPGGRRVFAVLTALEGDWMTFLMGEHLVRASSQEVAATWTGEYLLLWRPPAGYQQALRRGSEGVVVAWLKTRLTELAGEPVPAPAKTTFDAELEAQVIAFQRAQSLLADGIAGPRTLIHLQNTLGNQDAALLAANP